MRITHYAIYTVAYFTKYNNFIECKDMCKWNCLIILKFILVNIWNDKIMDEFVAGWEYEIMGEIKEAIKYYELSVMNGYTGAILHLNLIYRRHPDIEQKYHQKLEQIVIKDDEVNDLMQYYMEDCGNAITQVNIAFLYFMRKDYEMARKWDTISARAGLINAQYNLGYLYEHGKGVAKNCATAYRWYYLAALQGDSNAQYKLGYLTERGRGIEQNHEDAYKWFLLVANKGHALAQVRLGYMYQCGIGTQKDNVLAYQWWKKAAESGHPQGQYNLGSSYYYGNGVSQNYEMARKYFILAAQQGETRSMFGLGNMYMFGKGVDINYSEARKWYRLAASDVEDARHNLKILNESKKQIQLIIKLCLADQNKLSYILFLSMMQNLIMQIDTIKWTDKLVQKWIVKYTASYNIDPDTVRKWLDVFLVQNHRLFDDDDE